MENKEIRRNKEKEADRARRKKQRQRVVMMEKIIIVAVLAVVLIGGVILLCNVIPDMKVAKQLEEASAFIETEAYDDAIASCEEALKIDSTSVQAYRTMAGAYLTKEEIASAEQVLYQGWETTQDESLLQYYCTVMLNEAVADINNQTCTLHTLEKCVAVLEKDADNADAFRLMGECYERLFEASPEQEGLLCNASMNGTCGFKTYQDLMLRLLLVYEQMPSTELLNEIIRFAEPGTQMFWMDIEHLSEYAELLSRIDEHADSNGITKLSACVKQASEMQTFFAEAFAIFESGDFAPIRDFMNKEEYIAIRDGFLNGTMEHWHGATYIPVSREKMQFIKSDEGWKFAFANYEDYEGVAGLINIWGVKQEDAGVQRLAISYEPADTEQHTTYEFIYLYSNVQIGDEYVPQMNYRFETRVDTPEGTMTQLIGDWGGEHEWTTEF